MADIRNRSNSRRLGLEEVPSSEPVDLNQQTSPVSGGGRTPRSRSRSNTDSSPKIDPIIQPTPVREDNVDREEPKPSTPIIVDESLNIINDDSKKTEEFLENFQEGKGNTFVTSSDYVGETLDKNGVVSTVGFHENANLVGSSSLVTYAIIGVILYYAYKYFIKS